LLRDEVEGLDRDAEEESGDRRGAGDSPNKTSCSTNSINSPLIGAITSTVCSPRLSIDRASTAGAEAGRVS